MKNLSGAPSPLVRQASLPLCTVVVQPIVSWQKANYLTALSYYIHPTKMHDNAIYRYKTVVSGN